MASELSSTATDASSSNIINGKIIAATIREEIKQRVELQQITPGLAVILVGSRRDSQTYVTMKKKACAQVGFQSFGYDYPENVSEHELLNKIQELNANSNVHGILIQLPLPCHLNETKILHAVDPIKDVDGLHAANVALLYTSKHLHDWNDLNSIPFSIACTPLGCIELMDRSGVEIKGKHVVILGRSNLVGMPLSTLCLHRDATVTVAHSKSNNVKDIVKQGDIVVAAVGKANLVKKEWLKQGAVVIDVGINSIADDTTKKGYRLVGDVDYDNAKEVCSMITPVPGGVGPMTIAMLLRNTLNVCLRGIAEKKSAAEEEKKEP